MSRRSGSSPLDRAWSLLARVQVWFGDAEWHAVELAARSVDAGTRFAATSRLHDALTQSPERQALVVLGRAARDAPENMAPSAELAPGSAHNRHGVRLSRMHLDDVGRLLEQAVLAVALAPRLDPDDVAVLAAPVLSVVRAAGGESSATGRPPVSIS